MRESVSLNGAMSYHFDSFMRSMTAKKILFRMNFIPLSDYFFFTFIAGIY